MFRERNEWPSTAGEAEERSGYMELCDVSGPDSRAKTSRTSGGTVRRNLMAVSGQYTNESDPNRMPQGSLVTKLITTMKLSKATPTRIWDRPLDSSRKAVV